MESWIIPGLIGSVVTGTLVSQGFIQLATKRQWNRWAWMVIGWTIGTTLGLFITMGVLSSTYSGERSREEFLRELRSVSGEVSLELDRVRRGESDIAPEGQLELMLEEFDALEAQVISGSLPPRQERRLVSAWYVGDSWPYDYDLSLRIMGLQEFYRKMR